MGVAVGAAVVSVAVGALAVLRFVDACFVPFVPFFLEGERPFPPPAMVVFDSNNTIELVVLDGGDLGC